MLANLEFEIMYFETYRHDPRDILSVLQTTQKLLRQYMATSRLTRRLTVVAPKKSTDNCRLDRDLNIGPYCISGNIHLVIEDIAVRRIGPCWRPSIKSHKVIYPRLRS